MNPIELKQELYKLLRMISDATIDYEDKLRESGRVELSDDWRWNMHVLDSVPRISEYLEYLYAAPRERTACMMGSFLESVAGQSTLDHIGEHMRRLSDILEGRTPTWPPET